jgi:aryl-alcohol dehydrogenase-like predicted oxidoreductase
MEYRRLGNSGLQVSALGLGTNTVGPDLDEAATEAVIGRFLGLGMNFVDTANVYTHGTSESYIGAALARMKRRDDVILATKCGVPMSEAPNDGGASRQHIVASVDDSLRRLQTDHIDLLQMHRYDPNTPIEETLSALDSLVRQGKVRYIGCSNYAAWQLAEAMHASRSSHLERFVSIQSEYNLISRGVEQEVVPVCRRYGVGFIPWAPLAAGFLTGKYKRDQERPADSRGGRRPYWFFDRWVTGDNFDRVERLEQFAAERGHSLPELAITWLLHRPAVSVVIVGASRVAQVEANAKAIEWKLSADEVAHVPQIAG